MNCRNHSPAFLTMCLLASAAFTDGCATTGMEPSVNTSNSIQEVDTEMREWEEIAVDKPAGHNMFQLMAKFPLNREGRRS